MRIGRKLIALATMAIAAMAIAAPNALAQPTVEVTNEAAAGAHCPAITPTGGGCTAHGTSTIPVVLTAHIFGVESTVTTCSNEFTLRTDEDGNGRLEAQRLFGPECTRQPCAVTGVVQPWAATGSEPANGQLRLTVSFCVEPIGGGTDTTCELEVPFTENNPGHDYAFNPSGAEIPCHGPNGFRGEVTGSWISESTSRIEVRHL